jgi:M6 family metalloprotease-like protein
VTAAALVLAATATATIPPREGARWPEGYREHFQQARTVLQRSRGLAPLVRRLQANRAALAAGTMTKEAAMAAGGVTVSGTRSIPVLPVTFANTPGDPYPPANLQRELFDGPWSPGTMTDYYREISYGAFTVTGTVGPWRRVSRNDTFYEGGCNGLCSSGRMGDFLRESFDLHDAAVDFALYDNDGPDGQPNSGDDDGFVDFVALVHAESGGECGNNSQNLWSHRYVYSGFTGSEYTTNDARAGGGVIRIDDYVIMPAFACDGSTMIQIGVFAHEFGHAFGLPDLYDTDSSNGDSEGIGNWCLMASGSWGGDGRSPERPTHMSAWAKQFLGWLNPADVTGDIDPASLTNIEDTDFAYRIPISPTQYYLVSNRQRKKFDQGLPTAGLLIWRINETVINAGLRNNTVNADAANKGVDLEEADGRNDLDGTGNRGDAGDPFPGSSNKRSFDSATTPRSAGTIAICGIGDPADTASARIFVTRNRCESQPPPPPGGCSSAVPPPGSSGALRTGAWLLLLPALAGGWLALGMLRRNLAPRVRG